MSTYLADLLNHKQKKVIAALLFCAAITFIFPPLAGSVENVAGSSDISDIEAVSLSSDETSTPGTQGNVAVSLADVAIRNSEVNRVLHSISERQRYRLRLDVTAQFLKTISGQIDRDLEDTRFTLHGNASLPVLQSLQQKWQVTLEELIEQAVELTDAGAVLEADIDRLNNLQQAWADVRVDYASSEYSESISVRADKTLSKISETLDGLLHQLILVIDLQNHVEKETLRCDGVLETITDGQQKFVTRMFSLDKPPVWKVKQWKESGTGVSLYSPAGAFDGYRKSVKRYIEHPSQHKSVLVTGTFLLLCLFVIINYRVRKLESSGIECSRFMTTLMYPVAAALTVSLLIATFPYRSPIPAALRYTLQAVTLIPVIFLIRMHIPGRLRLFLYGYGFLFAFDTIRGSIFLQPFWNQILLIIESLVGAGFAVALMSFTRSLSEDSPALSWRNYVQAAGLLFLAVFVVGFFTAVIGNTHLTLVLTPGAIALIVVSMELYALLLVLIGIVGFSFRIWPLSRLNMVLHHRDAFETRIFRFLLYAGILGVFARYLSYVGLLEPVLDRTIQIVTTDLQIGTLHFAAIDIIYFVMTVWAAYAVSTFIRFVLNEDIYPRIQIAKGKSFAISSIFHYLIIAVGFVVAIGAMGVDLSKLTVLTGALGIGIGFGLQGVVNNFASGIMLLFERPVQVGDMVELDSQLCKVQKIGIRASTVRTRQGADIIIPNSQLVTEKVTNWTFGDRKKRIDLPVGLSYSASPEAVTGLLVDVANNNPKVLDNPAPQGLFVGYGESSIDFELRVWTEFIDEWPGVRSELATAVYDAVHDAGMNFPFPQREVRLLSDSKTESPPKTDGII